MESCDTNILVHAINPNDPLHAQAARYLQSRISNSEFVVCELVLTELYVLLRNPRVSAKPLAAREAVAVVQKLRSNPQWRILDYPGGLMEQVWELAANNTFPRNSIYDARLALTLRHYGVTRLATRNAKHFAQYGFTEVFDPTA